MRAVRRLSDAVATSTARRNMPTRGQPKGNQKKSSKEAVVPFPNALITKLPNGLKVMTVPTHHEYCRMALFAGAGTKHEQRFERGVAHCLEHVLTGVL
jgi:hypothetical protein